MRARQGGGGAFGACKHLSERSVLVQLDANRAELRWALRLLSHQLHLVQCAVEACRPGSHQPIPGVRLRVGLLDVGVHCLHELGMVPGARLYWHLRKGGRLHVQRGDDEEG